MDSWKEIAAYFGRTDRTVRRWEAELGLPVRRTPGQRQSRVHADVGELEAWRRGAGAAEADGDRSEAADAPSEAGDPAPETPVSDVHGRNGGGAAKTTWLPARLPLLGAAAALVALIGGVLSGGLAFPNFLSSASRPPLAAQRLYIAGMDDWAARTPASLERAVDEFRAAIDKDPGYAEAYAGLAQTYDLLREYTRMPASEAYGLAREAAGRALTLDDHLSSAHAALAFADYFGFWDAAGAKAHFQRAIALDPANATARHWYATFLLERGRFGEALAQIDAARALEPRSAAIAADRAFILNSLGRKTEAAGILRAIETASPTFMSPHAYLSSIAFDQGRFAEFLAEGETAARLGGDGARATALRAAAGALAGGGRASVIAALLADEKARYEAGDEDAYDVARWAALAGERTQALHFLALSADRHEAQFIATPTDPAFAGLRAGPSFRALTARLGDPPI